MGCNACTPAPAGKGKAAAMPVAAPALAAQYLGLYNAGGAGAGGTPNAPYAGALPVSGAQNSYAFVPFRAQQYKSDFLPRSYRAADLQNAASYRIKHPYLHGKSDVAFRTIGDFSIRELEDEMRRRKRLQFH